MFDRTLLEDGDWHMYVSWFGAGAIRVTKPGADRTARASRQVKSHLGNVYRALAARGFDFSPMKPGASEVLRLYAEAAWDPESPSARNLLAREPDEVADSLMPKA